jgi:serine protease AprX
MEIRPASDLNQNVRQSKAPSPQEEAPKSSQDVFQYTEKDVTPDGKIPIIVRAEGFGGVFKAKEILKEAKIKEDLPIINGFTADVDPQMLEELKANTPEGMKIAVDREMRIPDIITDETPVGIKLDTAVPTLGVDKLWEKGFEGKGVGIAIIDTGIYPHPDLKDRIVAFKDYVNGYKEPYDDQGHGTHVAGDAAGSGEASEGKYKGTAPKANLIGIKVLAKNGGGRFSDIVKGIQWSIQNKEKYNIRVINMSLGGPIFDSYRDDPVCQAVEKAVEAGILPVIAAGNSGPKASTIGSPGNDPYVLTVGALNDNNTVERPDDDVAQFSSRGPTTMDKLVKPDILSPGMNITAPVAVGSELDKHPKIPHVGKWYITISGTSMATPVMAGIAADIIGANPNLKPAELKDLFMKTATKLENHPEHDANNQGQGVVNPEKALEEALKRA